MQAETQAARRGSFWEGAKEKGVGAQEAVSFIRSGDRVFIHGAAATPAPLIGALAARRDIEGVSLYHLHIEGHAPFFDPGCEKRFRSISFFAGEHQRGPIHEGRADFIPVFLSDIPGLFTSGAIPLDAAILQLSPPDEHGMCSLGTSADAAVAAAKAARVIIAEINEQMPRTHGDNAVPFSRVRAFVATDRSLFEHPSAPEGPEDASIGGLVADMVEDGSTLQTGIGSIADAVLARLGGKSDLGLHTEMFSDGIVGLVEAGVITNRLKTVGRDRIVTSFVNGTLKVYDFVRDNPTVAFFPCDWTNDTSVIRRNPKVVAINSALSIDLTGQVCADSLGHRIYSGIGGQADFMRGAALSPGGKAIIAIRSTAAKGQSSRIVSELTPGSGVVTTRGHVHWVVTEFGAVNLHGKSLRERGEALISIAHPDFRPSLRREFSAIRNFPAK